MQIADDVVRSPKLSGTSAAGEQELELSVVMPCLNEAETVGTCVDKAMQALRDNRIAGEV